MARIRQTGATIIENPARFSWKRRPSEIRGYQRAYYVTTEDGDYVRVDYNLRDKRVRLYVELAEEGGSPYYSVIVNGRITTEKSESSGRTFGFASKFQSLADIFYQIPNRDVVKLMGNNYGIGASGRKKVDRAQRRKELEETKKRYFKPEEETGVKGGYDGEPINIISRVTLSDFMDIVIGFVLSAAAFLYFQYSFIALGVISAFYGIIIGLVDLFFRSRSPLFIKVIFFILVGGAAYIYGYFMY
ncbi:MAG: hypothetical protein JXA20_03320 [Spirochaetes bacterium]|nr:hypothetical protein [Spirochaetota bacterium]